MQELDGWLWWILAALLALAEMLVPGIYLIWLALAAALVGTLDLVLDWGWEWQMSAFALCAIGIVVAARKLSLGYGDNKLRQSEDNRFLHQRNLYYVGREVILKDPIEGGQGKISIDDSLWLASSARDLPAGTRVRVTGADGSVLQIEEVDGKDDSRSSS